jgi:hypothetical protein
MDPEMCTGMEGASKSSRDPPMDQALSTGRDGGTNASRDPPMQLALSVRFKMHGFRV